MSRVIPADAARHRPSRTLYQQVQDRLRQAIASGRFKEGDLIPSEQELARTYGVSQGTVRKAVLDLAHRGIFHRRQGRGTFVVFDLKSRSRLRNFRFVEGLNSELVHLHLGFVKIEVVAAQGEIADHLQLRRGAQVIRLVRLGKIDDESLVYSLSYLPKRLYKGLERCTAEDFVKNTLWKLQEIYFHIRVEKREEFISAMAADAEMARLLEVKCGSPLLRVEVRLTSFNGGIVEYRDSYCRLGPLKFYVGQRSA
jgi:GntR family transcriptional regulator